MPYSLVASLLDCRLRGRGLEFSKDFLRHEVYLRHLFIDWAMCTSTAHFGGKIRLVVPS